MSIMVGLCVYFDFSFCQLIDLQVSVAPRLILKPLVPAFPCFASIIVSLMEKVSIVQQLMHTVLLLVTRIDCQTCPGHDARLIPTIFILLDAATNRLWAETDGV